MTAVHFGCVVESHGETESVPILIRRIAGSLDASLDLHILPPLRTPKSRLVRPGGLERAVEFVARRIDAPGAIFVLLDSDDDCPAEEGPSLLSRARGQRGDFAMGVVLAKREFESWFLAAASSLRGHRALPPDLEPPTDPEAIRGAKEWLSARIPQGYRETLDQPALTAVFDLQLARSAPSFDKCYRDLASILRRFGGMDLSPAQSGP